MSPKTSPPSEHLLEGDLGNMRATETHVVVTPLSSLRKRPMLMVMAGAEAGKLFPLDGDETVIGRGHDAGVCIDEAGISRRHARVLRGASGSVVIEDLGSTNGVYLDGARIERATLQPGDKIQIGHHLVVRFSMIDSSEEAHARQLYDLATRDGLTQAFNRGYLTGHLPLTIARAERDRAELGLVMFDVDHFKKTNDTHGHVAGDLVLQALATFAAGLLSPDHFLSRYGGEEFVVVAPGATHGAVVRFAERLRRGVSELQIPFGTRVLGVRISAGAASLHERALLTPDAAEAVGSEARGQALLALADQRLYQAKASGRNRVVAA